MSISFLKYHFLLLLVLAALSTMHSKAQKITLSSIDETPMISTDLLIYEDTSSTLDIESVIDQKKNYLFKKQEKEIPSYSFSSSAIWCKFAILNKTKESVFLEIKPPFLNEIVLYSILDNGHIDSLCNGSLYSKAYGDIGSTGYIFKLPDNANLFYLRIKTNTRLFIVAKIGSETAFYKNNSSIDLITGIFGGIILMIFIYNLFLFITSRNLIYFYYLLHLLNTFLIYLYFLGLGKQFIWFDQKWINEHFVGIMSFGLIFPILFTINYLHTKAHSKNLHRGMLLSILALISVGLLNISGLYLLSGKLLNAIGFMIVIFVLYATAQIKRMAYKPATPFLYAWIFYLAGITIQVLQGLNIIPTSQLTSNAMQLGSTFEIILLSLSIAYQINYSKQKMQRSLVVERKALQEKEVLIKEQSKQLEIKAQKQSDQILAKKTILEQKNKEIIEQNEQIKLQSEHLKRANLLLANKNRIIEEQHNSLLFHKNNLKNIIDTRTSDLQKATKKATEADSLKTAFLKNVSHEIRTPMNAIAGFASLLFDIDLKDKRHDYYIDIITKNTDDLLNLIDNIIELSKIQTGSLKVKKVVFNPQKVFKALHELFIEKMRDERKSFVSIKMSIPEIQNFKIKTDYNRFWQIIFHLVDNAIKYTDKGFVEFGYKFADNERNSLEIFVKDSGKGINQEKLKTVFDRFRKTEDDKTKLYSGTGLGLSLVKGLTEYLNGTITVNTKTKDEFPNELSGTIFKVIFKDIIVEKNEI